MGRQVRQQGIHLSYTLPRFKNVAVPGDNSRHLLGTRIKNSVTKGDAKHKLYTTHNKTSARGGTFLKTQLNRFRNQKTGHNHTAMIFAAQATHWLDQHVTA